jgi:uncharacterized protein (DUF1501 family)
MNRRTFIKNTVAASIGLPLMINGSPLRAFSRHLLFKSIDPLSDRVLVLIQLNGGNDGLNMVLPLDQYDNLANVRSNILIPEKQILTLSQKTGIHPAMSGLKIAYDDGQLCIVQNVGYPDQNRSHFRSTDIWQTGSASNQVINTGWLGRLFDSRITDYPNGFPNADAPDPFALTVGNIITETCQGVLANYSLAVQDPLTHSTLFESEIEHPDHAACYGKELNYVMTAISQTNAYGGVITTAAENGSNLASYPEDNQLAQQLKIIARLISGGLGTKVYVANLGGFDTHANQVEEDTTTEGRHANLLRFLSEAISIFLQDLTLQGLNERVVGMTYSEFGRRIRSNGANGTDHGSAAPLFVFGSCVNATIIGENPVIQVEVHPQEGVAMQYDFRSVYGSILHQWFEVPVEEVKSILFDGFSEVPLISGCDNSTSISEEQSLQEESVFICYPNPSKGLTTVRFNSLGEQIQISIFNNIGYEVARLHNGFLDKGIHERLFQANHLPPGNYYVRLRTSNRQQTTNIIIIK